MPFKGASVSLAVGYIILPGPSNPFQSGYTLTKTGNPIQTWSLQNVENPPYADNKDMARLKGKSNLTDPSRNGNQIILPLNMINLGLRPSGEEKVSCKHTNTKKQAKWNC